MNTEAPLFPEQEYEHTDSSEPYVKCEVTKNTKGYGWKVKVCVKGNDTDELIRLTALAEEALAKKYGAQS